MMSTPKAQAEFLTLYNEELRFLHESGRNFAQAYPQVAQHLGMLANSTRDPFVERLLEGTAFLTARVQQRLNTEQAVVAMQMFNRIAPGWMTPTPAISTVALIPDFTSPQWTEQIILPRGTQVALSDPSLKQGEAIFTTGHAIQLLPLEITQAECSITPAMLPNAVMPALNNGQSFLRLRLSTHGVVPLSRINIDSLSITLAGDAVRANQLITTLLTQTLCIVAWASVPDRKGAQAPRVMQHILPATALQLCGMQDEEALLPPAIGEFPGMRLLREYFANPSRYYSLALTGLRSWLAGCGEAEDFEIVFVLKNRTHPLIDKIQAADFRLFSSPIINLHPVKCSPLIMDGTRTEQRVVVDRMRQERYEIHHITAVKGMDAAGHEYDFSAHSGHARFGESNTSAAYASRRQRSPAGVGRQGKELADEIFLSLSAGATALDTDSITTLLIDAVVCQRDIRPAHLQCPTTHIHAALPLKKVELLRTPSVARPAPDIELGWLALQAINDNPLRHARPAVADCSATLRHWLSNFSALHHPHDQRRISSIRAASIEHHFERCKAKGPLAWTRSLHALLEIDPNHHADEGAYLFAQVVEHALRDFCDLNQNLSASFSFRQGDHDGR